MRAIFFREIPHLELTSIPEGLGSVLDNLRRVPYIADSFKHLTFANGMWPSGSPKLEVGLDWPLQLELAKAV